MQLALGAPPLFYAFIMIASGNVMMALTHYAIGTAPVIFGTGCVTLKKWWSTGFVRYSSDDSCWAFLVENFRILLIISRN